MKSSRHMAILKIIKENDVETQYDLARLLQENGYNVTQATVSRDIKLLNLIKVSENGRQRYPRNEAYKGGTQQWKTEICCIK